MKPVTLNRTKYYLLQCILFALLLFPALLIFSTPVSAEFIDQGNGTIFDNQSGLTWQKSDDGITRTWQEALEYSESLTLASCTSWRLPNRKELRSIVDRSLRDPAIDPIFNSYSDKYWTSTPVQWSFNRIWSVDFYKGSLKLSHPLNDVHYIRAVTGGCEFDSTPPETISISPDSGSSNIPITSRISVGFNEEINQATLTPSSFRVEESTIGPVSGTISYSNGLAELTPSTNLAYNSTYTVTLTTDIQDLAGNPLLADQQWFFDTEVEADTQPPTGSIRINSGAAYSTTTSVILMLSAIDNSGAVALMQFRQASGQWSDWEPFQTTQNWILPSGDGTETVEVRFQDHSGNISLIYNDSITIDTISPTVSINPATTPTGLSSQTLTGQTEIGSTITVSSDTWTTISNMSVTGTYWQCLVSGLATGQNTLAVVSTDAAGNVSSPVSTTILYDNIVPTGTVVIDNGNSYTNTSSVTLSLSASDNLPGDIFYRAANSGATFSQWQLLAGNYANLPWQLPQRDGVKTVLIQVRDISGNISSTITASITLDTVAPSVSVVPEYTETNQGSILLSGTMEALVTVTVVTDTQATVDAIEYPTDTNWQTVINNLIPGSNTLTVTATDLLDNATQIYSQVLYDNEAPTGTLGINQGAATTNSENVLLAVTVNDSQQVSDMSIRNAGDISWGSWVAFTSSSSPWVLPQGDGEKTVEIRLRDVSGNISETINDTIELDTSSPAVTINPTASPVTTSRITISGTREAGATISISAQGTLVGPVAYTTDTWSSVLILREGTNAIIATATDNAGNSSSASAAIILDSKAEFTIHPPLTPTSATSQLLSGTMEEGSTITVSAGEATAEPVYMSGTSWSCQINDLSQGNNLITVNSTDSLGNNGSNSAAIYVDNEGPTGAMVINNDADLSSSRNIILFLSIVEDSNAPSTVLIRNQEDGTWSAPRPFSSRIGWTLSDGDGQKTVEVQFQDTSANVSPIYEDMIVLDTVSPALTIDTVTTPTSSVTQVVSGTRESGSLITVNTSGILTEQVSYPDDLTWLCTVSLVNGENYITAIATDPAGNRGSATTSIFLDNATYLTINAVSSPTKQDAPILVSGTREADATVTISAPTATISDVDYLTPTTWQYILDNLAIGNNSITATATDLYGNSVQKSIDIFVDRAIPSGSILINNDADITNSSTVTLSFSYTDNDTHVSLMRVRNNGSSWRPWMAVSATLSWSLLPTDGMQNVDVEFQDAAGNISAVYSDSINVDRTAPAVTINPVISPTVESGQLLSGSMEAGATINIIASSITTGPIVYTSTTWESELSSIPEGVNTITVLASDAASNTGSAATTIIVDNTARVSIDALNSPINQTSMFVSGTRDPDATIDISINATPSSDTVFFPTPTTWRSYITSLQEGNNQINVTSTDLLGNTGSATGTVIVDSIAPFLTVEPLPPLGNQKTLLLFGTMEPGAFVAITAPGVSIGSITQNSGNWSSFLTLAEGNNAITVTASDTAGNETAIDLQTTLDTIAKVTINPIPYTSEPVQTLTGTIETGSTIQLSVNTSATLGSVTTNGSSWQCQVTLVAGANIFTVDTTDPLGNFGHTGTTVTLDTIDPTITIDPPPTLVSKTDHIITGTKSSDGTISITSPTASVQALSYPSNSTWQAKLLLGEGPNDILATVTDPAGNSSSANTQITLDSLAELTFNPLPHPTNAVSHTISGTFEAQSVLSVSSAQASISPLIEMNGTNWSGSLSLSEGNNTITVQLTDSVGNSNSISQIVTLDSIIPRVTIDPVPNFLTIPSVTLSGTRDSDALIIIRGVNTQQGSSFTALGDRPSSTTWTKEITLPDGENSITVTAKDPAGNESSASVSITVDTATSVTMASIPSPSNAILHHLNGTMESGATVAISINGNVPVEAMYDSPNDWSFEATLTEGTNQITVTATDVSLNEKSITANVVVDMTPPAQITNLIAVDTMFGGSILLDWVGYPANAEGVTLFNLYVSQTDFSNITNMIPLRQLSPGSSNFSVSGVTNDEAWYFAVVGVDSSGNFNPLVITESAIPTTQGINGYVSDEATGIALWGARVQLSDERYTLTNKDGYFHLSGLHTGTYNLSVSGGGYESASSSGIIVETAMMTGVDVSLNKIIVPPSIPQGVSASAGDGQVTLSWNDIPDTFLDGYRVFRFASPSDTNPVQINPELIIGTFFVDMDLINNQTYYYTVRSVDRSGLTSTDSTMVSATPAVVPPLPASNLVATLNPDNTVELTWGLSPTVGIDTYNIYSDNGTGDIDYSAAIDTATTSTWTSPQAIDPGTTHYFGLRAEKNGLEENNTVLVASVTVPLVIYSGPKVIIAVPHSGGTISGNLLTLEGAIIQGDSSQIKHVSFQFRPRGSTLWNDIASASASSLNPDIDAPYFIHWDVITDVPVGEYELRAVTTANDNSVDPTPETIVVLVDHANATYIEDSNNGEYHHRVRYNVRHWLNNRLKFYAKNYSGAFVVTVPSLASDSDSEIIAEIPKHEEMAPKLQGYASIGRYLRLKLSSGQKQFSSGREVEITIPYPDADNDDIVDGTSIHVDDLELRWYNPGSQQWENSGIIEVSVDKVAKTITAKTGHFSVFAVLGTDASGGISSSTSSHDFGLQDVGTTSPSQTFTIAQDGSSVVTIGSITITGLHPGDFTVIQDDCSNATLAPAEICQIVVTFTPAALGIRSSLLSIPSSDSGSPLEIDLNGEGISALTDSDGDGVADVDDAFPNDPTETADTDGDGVGDNADAFPTDPTRWEVEAPPTSTQVPVQNGLWLIPSILAGGYLMRRRKGQLL